MNNTKELSFVEKLKLPLSTLWNNYRLFFLLFLAILIVYKFRGLLMDYLIFDAKKSLNQTIQKDEDMKLEIDRLNQKSKDLIKESENLEVKPVDENWHLK